MVLNPIPLHFPLSQSCLQMKVIHVFPDLEVFTAPPAALPWPGRPGRPNSGVGVAPSLPWSQGKLWASRGCA